ncbi:hypothetical protein SAMN05892877_105353 [Rhizobium subbaraonis]|uniref:Tip attachment protein J central straight fiber domain-containing protein n=1 Tax=Rhizobium subbaraonis TaxID=908946 RepID=A0A285UBA3_9HYPH|nr:hypothetical protein [Rhizobium subbaraonis]SOC38967.1 hypothetical protein SAMN05892877_105353 [Rhizobium subbaraonis]
MKRRSFLAFLGLAPLAAAGENSELHIEADRFVIRNGSEKDKPLVVSDGVLRMKSAHLGTVNAGVLKSASRTMRMDLAAGTIVITS